MLRLDVSSDLRQAADVLSSLERRHVPFALALALTAVASDARDAVRADLPRRFTLRRPWIARGIGVERATKTDLTAHVFSRDAFMADQETGGVRTGTQIIPMGRIARIHQSKVIPRSQWPGRLGDRKSTFYRAGTLFERRGRNIQPVYLFRRKVRIAPRFGMSSTVRGVVDRQFARRFDTALQRALFR